MDFSRAYLAICGAALALVACGGSEASSPAKSPDDNEEQSEHHGRNRSTLAMGAEIGALDEEHTDKVFEQTMGALERCLHSGAQRVEFLGGQVKFFVKVGTGGQVSHAHLEESTIGDRETEKCMLNALKAKTWPKPQGGEAGYARKGFDFDPPNDVREPTNWGSDRVSDTVDKVRDKIDGCKSGARGHFTATMYVGTEGNVLAVGMAPPDEQGEDVVDCIVDVLKQAKFPSPGSWPAKVTFTL